MIRLLHKTIKFAQEIRDNQFKKQIQQQKLRNEQIIFFMPGGTELYGWQPLTCAGNKTNA
jgi:hypothetical protein